MNSMRDLYAELKQKSLSTIESIDGNERSGSCSDVFKHNLKVLIELCDKQLNIDYRNENPVTNDDNLEKTNLQQLSVETITLSDTDEENRYKKESDDDNSDCEPTKKEKTYESPRHYLDIKITGSVNWYSCIFDRSVCNKKFKNRLEAIAHVRTHTGEKPYKCSNVGCDYRTAQLRNVRNHRKSCDKRTDN